MIESLWKWTKHNCSFTITNTKNKLLWSWRVLTGCSFCKDISTGGVQPPVTNHTCLDLWNVLLLYWVRWFYCEMHKQHKIKLNPKPKQISGRKLCMIEISHKSLMKTLLKLHFESTLCLNFCHSWKLTDQNRMWKSDVIDFVPWLKTR